jgi:predicted nucleic acid-binding protein
MILVDTSVLVDFLKNKSNEAVETFNKILEFQTPFGITSHIYQELLQGAATQKDFDTLKTYLDTFTLYAPQDRKTSYAQAAHIYFLCQRRGITVRSTIDCLIAQIAIEHKCPLLHNDKDFYEIHKVVKDLQFL